VAFLRSEGALNAAELGALERGDLLAKVIDTQDRSEVLSFAVVRVKTTAERVLGTFRDVEGRREPWILQIGRLSSPTPTPGDLQAMTLDARDVRHLSKCRQYQCDVRLPADAIERFRREVDWSSASHAANANSVFRQMLLTYASSYLERGNRALFEYVNNNEPVRIGDSLEQLLQRTEFLREATPDLYTFLERFPESRPTSVEDFLYWFKEKFWLLNVLSLNHVAIIDRPTASGRMILFVSKQLYATHYYESSLAIAGYLESRGSGSYLVLVNRTRADIRRSGFTWLERVLLRRMVRGRIEGQLKHLRLRLESGPTERSPRSEPSAGAASAWSLWASAAE
jgi:hypothetical protein